MGQPSSAYGWSGVFFSRVLRFLLTFDDEVGVGGGGGGGGRSCGVKVSCTLCHRGVQLILAYRWARPAILVVGKS